jgi:hypothetical protein
MGIGILLFALTATMNGCFGPMTFENVGSANTLEQDRYDCEIIVNSGPFAHAYARDPMGNMGYPYMARKEMQRCLERKGWRLTDGEGQAKKADTVTSATTTKGSTDLMANYNSYLKAMDKMEDDEPNIPSKSSLSDKSIPAKAPIDLGIVPAVVTPLMANILNMEEIGGVLVTAVYAGSVASKGGIKKGDVILKYGDKVLSTDLAQFRAALAATSPGDTVPLMIWRNRSQIALTAQF